MNIKQKTWDAVARKKIGGNQKDYRHLPILPKLLRGLGCGDDSRVVDLGCYNASDLVEIAKLFENSTFFGYEISPSAINAARHLVVESGLEKSVTILQQDIEDVLPVPDRYFDISIAKYILPFVEDKLLFLTEVKRVSSQGVIIATPVVNDSGDANLSERDRSISIERGAFHKIMEQVFGKDFVVREVFKDSRNDLIEIEVVTAKTD